MALGDPEPQNEILFRYGRHRLAGQYNCARGYRHRQHPAGCWRQHFPFRDLLFDHRAFGSARLQRVISYVKGRLRGIECNLRCGAMSEQFLRPFEIGFGLVELSLQTRDLGVQRLDLEHIFFVCDSRYWLVLLNAIALPDGELHDSSADACACRNNIGAFHRGEYSLLIADRLRRDMESVISTRVLT